MSDLLPNIVKFSGSPQAINTLKRDCCRVEETGIALDFEKILPIPEDIDERKKDWLLGHWGADWYGDFEVVSDTSKKLVLRFTTIGGPPVGIYARCTGLISGLSVEAKCLDDPSGHASKVIAKGGVATLSDLPFTDRLAYEITGETQFLPVKGSDYQTEPPPALTAEELADLAATRLGTMSLFSMLRSPRRYRRYRQMEELLEGYPIYAPPYPWGEWTMREREARANFEHFMATKPERLRNLGAFFVKAGIPSIEGEQAFIAVCDWYEENIGYVLPFLDAERATLRVIRDYMYPWVGKWIGCNLANDIITYFGDFFIDRAAQFDWIILYENKKPERRGPYGTGKPMISSMARGVKLSLYDDILNTTMRRAGLSKIVSKDIKRSLRDRATIKQNIENYLRGAR